MSSERKQHVLKVVDEFLRLAADVGDTEAQERIQVPLARYRLGLFRIVVVGEIKKGKSSFINALLGQPDLLPTASDVATSTVYKIMYGKPPRTKVFFGPKNPDDDTSRPEPVEISHKDVPAYGTEDQNPGNRKGVDFIGIQATHPLLKEGIAIIDTPGLGGLFAKHRDITWRYLPSADAVFFVMDSIEAVASKAEMDMLKKIRDLTPLVFFVQTKTDLVDERQWKQWQERNLAILEETLGVPKAKLLYFPVSAQLKLDADTQHDADLLELSGFVPLTHFIQHKLLPRKQHQVGQQILKHVAVETAAMRRRLDDNLRVATADTKDGLDALEREFVEAKARFEEWKTKQYTSAVTTFQERATDFRREWRQRLAEALDPSPYGSLISPLVHDLRESNVNPKDLNAHAEELVSLSLNQCSEQIFEIQGGYNQAFRRLVRETAEVLQHDLDCAADGVISGVEQQSSVDSLHMHFSAFEEARNTMYGGMAGAMMANVTMGLIGLAFPPAAAAAGIAALAGAVIGGAKASSSLKLKRQEEAITKLQSVLCDSVRRAQTRALNQFDSAATRYEQSTRKALASAAAAVEQDLAQKLKSIADARQASREDLHASSTKVKGALSRTNDIIHALDRLAAQDAPPKESHA